jgi:hypothetical protein
MMSISFLHVNKRKLLASLVAGMVLLPAGSAIAWWDRYGPDLNRSCNPQQAYMIEYGFLDYWGPSISDLRRLDRDQWKAIYYGDVRYDPVAKALRKRCPRSLSYGWDDPYVW